MAMKKISGIILALSLVILPVQQANAGLGDIFMVVAKVVPLIAKVFKNTPKKALKQTPKKKTQLEKHSQRKAKEFIKKKLNGDDNK